MLPKDMNNIDRIEGGTFEETFPICTMGLILSCTYPSENGQTKKKLLHLIMVYLTMVPGIMIIVCHMVVCALSGDYMNFSRQIIIELVIIIFISKTSIIFAKGNKLRQIFDIISNDFVEMKSTDEDFKKVFNKYRILAKRSELLLLVIAIILATLYPAVSMVSILYTYLFTDEEYKTYDNMVNPLIVKGLEEVQFTSPCYELIWLYCAYVCAIMSPCFAGIDGSFGIACSHISLKFEMMSLKLNKTLADSVTKEEVKTKLKSVIVDHVKAKKFYDTVQEMYQDWLLVVYLLSSSIISLNLYQISIDVGVNLQFLIFIVCAIIHIYIPCYCATWINEV